jgi:DNA-binding LacI/PurR family transcriptional regulator
MVLTRDVAKPAGVSITTVSHVATATGLRVGESP